MKKKKAKSDEFTGSIWQRLGYVNERCKRCNTYLHGAARICLNGCHLGEGGLRRFQKAMTAVIGKVEEKA